MLLIESEVVDVSDSHEIIFFFSGNSHYFFVKMAIEFLHVHLMFTSSNNVDEGPGEVGMVIDMCNGGLTFTKSALGRGSLTVHSGPSLRSPGSSKTMEYPVRNRN